MSQAVEVKVPDIGDFENVPVIEILVQPGDSVAAEDSLLTLESDKATMEVPSPVDGVVQAINVALGDTVTEGDVVLLLEPTADNAEAVAEEPEVEAPPVPETPVEATAPPPVKAQTETIDKPVPAAQPVSTTGLPYASPAVRAYARELGVDLGRVNGSGRKGRITKDDVTALVKQVMQTGSQPPPASGLQLAPPPKLDFSKFGATEVQPLSRIKKISGPNLARNWATIPHVTHHDEADITDLEAFRKANKAKAAEQGYKLTPLAFLVKACAKGLKEFPNFNASLDSGGTALIVKKYCHIGIAVDTPEGLVVPVVRDADQKSLMEVAAELGEISQRARERKLSPKDLSGGCFSISSLGGIGGVAFTPIINAPEVAILGVSRSKMQPQWDGSQFQPRLMLPLSLSYDHRIIDGADAARFCRYLAGVLEDIRQLLL